LKLTDLRNSSLYAKMACHFWSAVREQLIFDCMAAPFLVSSHIIFQNDLTSVSQTFLFTAIHGELYLQANGGLLFVDKSKAGCSLNGQYFINKAMPIFPGDEILVGTQSTGIKLRLMHMNMARPSFPDDRGRDNDGKDASLVISSDISPQFF
jgi:hypothetical protein